MCRRCGVPFTSARQGGTEGLCTACLADPPLFGQARAALRYDANARRLILPFKHADRLELVEVLAPMMARAGAGLLRQAELLIPVPLHRRRLFARKYNQAALLARALGRVAGRRVLLDGMVRHRATVSLGDKTARERAVEVADAFAVQDRHAGTVAGRRVLLIDDVMTSGATANACAGALLRSGAAGVDVLVAARVPDPRRD
jgi:ComF family protein